MSLDRQLSALEAAELIRQAQQQPELEYLFRHALVRDAVSNSLLRKMRQSFLNTPAVRAFMEMR